MRGRDVNKFTKRHSNQSMFAGHSADDDEQEACRLIPWFKVPPSTPPTDFGPYRQGTLQCEVLTANGQLCGNAQGTTRCRDYCVDLQKNWMQRLLPIAIQIMRNENASVYAVDRKMWVPASTKFSNAEAWERLAAHVNVELFAYRGSTNLLYHGTMKVRPATEEGVLILNIMTKEINHDAIESIKEELIKMTRGKNCHIVKPRDDDSVISIRTPLKTKLKVGNAVALGLRILMMDVLSRVKQPFSINCRYSLPGVVINKQFETDDGMVSGIRGLRLGGLDP